MKDTMGILRRGEDLRRSKGVWGYYVRDSVSHGIGKKDKGSLSP
jgi:hypothetical protein